MRALAERKAEEVDTMTVAFATAISINFSADALREWKAARRVGRPRVADAQNQNAAIGRLAAMFPGAVKVNN
jgi:hypothetical protein